MAGTTVLAVNIRAGGSRAAVDALVARACGHHPDVAIFSEYRDNRTGASLRAALDERGFVHQADSEGGPKNGVLIAAREAFAAIANPFGLSAEEYPNAVLQATLANGLRVYGVYLPGQIRKRPHLRCLIATARRTDEAGIEALCIGDFNSGRDATDIEINAGRARLRDAFDTADLYLELEREWTEAWLHLHPGTLEYSWYPFRLKDARPPRNGWRIDKAFVSRALLPRLASAEYDHGFRTEKLTDHSALVVSFSG